MSATVAVPPLPATSSLCNAAPHRMPPPPSLPLGPCAPGAQQTSGGTVLSTNWKEVATTDYERDIKPPAGQEARKWDT
jgi:hypothetical protein